ncbi:hypothetical protein L1887_36458 [Cichorium endivia]|nr:hypothetical protein L1887_36458 [Cichorium endivia]
MEAILERYEQCSYAERLPNAPDTETLASWTLESSKLMAKIEVLEKNIKHYVGEGLESLNLRELQNVEQHIDTALKRIRTKKNQVMHESISQLHKKLNEKEETTDPQPSQPQAPDPIDSLTIGGDQFLESDARGDGYGGAHQMSATQLPPWMLQHVHQ